MIKKVNKIFTGVYLLHDPNSKIYKIGQSSNCISRFNRHKTSNPNIVAIGIIQTNKHKELEKEIHKKFKSLNYRLEWFYENDLIITYFKDHEKFISIDVLMTPIFQSLPVKYDAAEFDNDEDIENDTDKKITLNFTVDSLRFLTSDVSEKIIKQTKISKCVMNNKKQIILEIDKFNDALFYDFLQKLFKKSIVFYGKSFKDGEYQIIYMLNPTIGKKFKNTDKDLTGVFEDLSIH